MLVTSLPPVESGPARRERDRVILRGVHARAEHVAVVPFERVLPAEAVVSGQRHGLLDRADRGPGRDQLYGGGAGDCGLVAVVDAPGDRVDQVGGRAQGRLDLAHRLLETRQGGEWGTQRRRGPFGQKFYEPVPGRSRDAEIETAQAERIPRRQGRVRPWVEDGGHGRGRVEGDVVAAA